MNNSLIIEDTPLEVENTFDKTPWLRQRESELISIIEAIERVADSPDWNILKNSIFSGLEESLEGKLNLEAKKDDPNKQELARLTGQLIWAKKYADFKKLSEVFRLELSNVKKQLNGK